jgi:2-succinyl-5-enolpyruvyl-6-hydroxy-3-cyclohexene-1-carboxylate synthase
VSPADTYLGLRAFVDELVRCGLREACTSPGSRSTPLVLSLVRDRRLRSTSHLDERAGGFFALGAAKASGRPVALACTSGTAAANYAPAVIEAHQARVPLLVLTADRPPELRDLGAGQTIDQLKLYGSAAKWFLDVDEQPAAPERMRWLRQLACRAYWTALDGRPGPVHLNFTLREPLVLDEPLPDDEPGGGGRAGGRPWVTRPRTATEPGRALVHGLVGELAARPRAVIVAGRVERDPALGAALGAFAPRAAVPLIADPLSGGRRGPAAAAHYDALLRDTGWADAHRPQLVLRVGDLPTSKPLRQWLHGLGEETLQIALDPENAWQDPGGAVATLAPADPAATLAALAEGLEPPARSSRGPHGLAPGRSSDLGGPAPERREWLDAWTGADRRRPARSRRRWAPPASRSRAWPPSSACGCRPRRRWSWPRPCRCATSRPSSPCATRRRACCPIAAPTASTGPCRPPTGLRRRRTARSSCSWATSRSRTTSAGCSPGAASACR